MKTDLFQSCGHCWIFQICWQIECSTFTASSLWIWKSSTGIPSPPLALFVVMLPKAHLTSHSRMSLGEWSHHHGYLSHESCHLFLLSSASGRSLPFLSFIVHIFAWNVPCCLLFFWRDLSSFPLLLFSSISLHWSLRKAFLCLLSILWNSAFRCLYRPFFSFAFHFSSFHRSL